MMDATRPARRRGHAGRPAALCTGALCLLATLRAAGAQTPDDPMLVHDDGRLSVRAHLQAGLNAVAERNLFWNLSDTFAPAAGFDTDADWLEAYLKPGLGFEYRFDGGDVVYGKVSAVASYTVGTDAFDARNTGRVTLEEGYLGYRTRLSDKATLDVSIGPRELRLGTGMLIANGGADGFERGALKFGPRFAWEMAGIARLTYGDVTATAFYIEPSELSSSDSDNSLAGFDLRYDSPSRDHAGLSFVHVLTSDAPYPQAAPGGIGAPVFTPGAREGLNALSVYGRVNPFAGDWSGLFLAADAAYEWNDRIDMRAWAGRMQVGYRFSALPWSPTLTYSVQTFSGDDPDTPGQERFDPLYYDGSPGAWATGSKSAMVFINSNVMAHGLALRLEPTRQDFVTLRYAHVRANRLRSPLQFGQATRFDLANGLGTVVSGVTDAHVSDDVFVEYTRVLTPNAFLTAGLSVSIPGEGIRRTVPGDTPVWLGGFVNLVINY